MNGIVIRIFALLCACMLFSCRAEPAPPSQAPQAGPEALPTDPGETVETIPITIRTDNGDHVFNVEIAATPEEQTRGLMFRDSLPENGGMLFPSEPRIASFWMRNTLIPLDMIFIRQDGRISNIEHDTEPYSLESRRSTEPVIAVLEIAGGRAAELGIEAGDHASWPGGPRLGNVELIEN